MALARSAIRSSWRTSASRSSGGSKYSKWLLFWNIFTYLLSGLILASVFRINNSGESLHLAVCVLTLYAFLITLSNILVEFGSGFLSSDELTILSPLPVSSETFFVSRLLVLFFYAGIISLLLGLGPSIVLGIIREEWLTAIVGVELAYLFATMASAFTVILVYSLLLRKVPRKKLTKVLSYAQGLGSLFMVSSFVIIPKLLESGSGEPFLFADAEWLRWTPGYLYSSLTMLLIGGPISITVVIVALLSVPVLGVLAYRLLADHYTDSVTSVVESAASTTRSATPPSTNSRFASLLRTPESRVMWTLFRAQIRYDTKLRMSLLSMLPVTAMYFVLVIANGTISDPFVHGAFDTVLSGNMLYLLILLSPLLIMMSLSQSEAHKASWIFYSTPVDRSRLLLGMRNIVLICLFLPYLIILAATFAWFMPLSHALMHTLMLGMIGSLLFEIFLYISPKLPFGEQRKQQRSGWITFVWMMLVMIVPGSFLMLIIYFAYTTPTNFWLYAVGIALVATIVHFLLKRRLSLKMEEQEYIA